MKNKEKEYLGLIQPTKTKFCYKSLRFLGKMTLALILISIIIFILYFFFPKSDEGSIDNENYYLEYFEFNGKELKAKLKYQGSKIYYNENKLSPIYENLLLTVSYDTKTELTVKITDINSTRFTLPYIFPFPYTKNKFFENQDYYFEVSPISKRFSLKIIRNSTQEVIFDSFDLIFSEYYLELTIILPTFYLFGLGERRQGFKYKDGIYTIWPKDQYLIIDNGAGPDHQLYGQHPMYLMREKSGLFHTVFLRNSHGMDIIIKKNVKELTFKLIDGIFEFKIFLGDEYPDTSIKQYHNYINNYTLMPFWSMGYHQSKWGYSTSQKLRIIVKMHHSYDIPLDGIWSDLDYLYHHQDFTVSDRFKSEDFELIREWGVKWIPILDIGIPYDSENESYKEGIDLDVFIKSSITNKSLINCVWPGKVVYPDFNHPNISLYWHNQLFKLFNKLKFDGIWLDMNEPSAFKDGELYSNESCPPLQFFTDELNPSRRLEFDNFHSSHLPYRPGFLPLENKTISLNSTHSAKGDFIKLNQEKISEFKFHGLSGFFESIITYNFLRNNVSNILPFILSRNNLFGQGKFTSHWTGDNLSDWPFLETSISEIFNYQLFGSPFTGVDICGFSGGVSEELCTRFIQVGAFFPFSRNHNEIFMKEQELFAWGLESNVYKAGKLSLKTRYSILKWYYSIFVRNEGGGSVFKPIFFEFPFHEKSFFIEDQFLLGREIMIAPCLKDKIEEREVYFPGEDVWFEFFEGQKFYSNSDNIIKCPLNSTAPIFIREGSIIHLQDVNNVKTVNDLANRFSLKIAMKKIKESFQASGFIMNINEYNDSNIKFNCMENSNCIAQINASVQFQDGKYYFKIEIKNIYENLNFQNIYIEKIQIFGIQINNKYIIVDLNLNSQLIYNRWTFLKELDI